MFGLFFSQQFGQERNAVNVLGSFNAGQFTGCWQKIPESRNMITFSALFNCFGPISYHRHPDAPFVEVAFNTSESSVAVEKFRIIFTFGVWPVIAGNNNQGVFIDAQCFQLSFYVSYVFVHAANHSCQTFLRFGPVFISIYTVIRYFHSMLCHQPVFVVSMWYGISQIKKKGRTR